MLYRRRVLCRKAGKSMNDKELTHVAREALCQAAAAICEESHLCNLAAAGMPMLVALQRQSHVSRSFSGAC